MLKHDFVKPTYPKKFINNYSESMKQQLGLKYKLEAVYMFAILTLPYFAFLAVWASGDLEGMPIDEVSYVRRQLIVVCLLLMLTAPFLVLRYYGLVFPTLRKNAEYYNEHMFQITKNLLWKYDADLKLYNHNVLTALVEHCKAKGFTINKLDNITHENGVKFARYDYTNIVESYRINLEIPPEINPNNFGNLFY